MHACTMAPGARAMQCAYCKAFQPSGEVCPDGWWYCDACWDWWQRWLDDGRHMSHERLVVLRCYAGGGAVGWSDAGGGTDVLKAIHCICMFAHVKQVYKYIYIYIYIVVNLYIYIYIYVFVTQLDHKYLYICEPHLSDSIWLVQLVKLVI